MEYDGDHAEVQKSEEKDWRKMGPWMKLMELSSFSSSLSGCLNTYRCNTDAVISCVNTTRAQGVYLRRYYVVLQEIVGYGGKLIIGVSMDGTQPGQISNS